MCIQQVYKVTLNTHGYPYKHFKQSLFPLGKKRSYKHISYNEFQNELENQGKVMSDGLAPSASQNIKMIPHMNFKACESILVNIILYFFNT